MEDLEVLRAYQAEDMEDLWSKIARVVAVHEQRPFKWQLRL